MEKLKKYTAKPEAKKIYSTLDQAAKVFDIASYAVEVLSKGNLIDALEKMNPALANRLSKVGRFARMLGPAGAVLGTGLDLLVGIGAMEVKVVEKLDKISQQMDDLKEEVNVHIKVTQALGRFLPIHDKVLACVLRYEQVVANPGSAESFCDRLGDMIKDYTPNQIVVDLNQMHSLITGETGFGKPLFEQLSEEAYTAEGADLDKFIASLLLRFQSAMALQIRAVRMLRSFIAYQEEDAFYASDMVMVIKNLALQRKEYDPSPQFDWYFQFMAFGGQATLTVEKWPNWYLYMSNDSVGNIRGCEGHPGDQGVFNISPGRDGFFRLTTKKWPTWYVYMESSSFRNVRGWEGDPGKQGYWRFIIKDLKAHCFTFVTQEYPECYMYMQENAWGNISGTDEMPDSSCSFQVHLI